MNCCEQSGTGMGCNQGRNCPVRATRNAGVCNPEPDEEQTRDDVVAFVVLLTPETSGARSASALGDLLASTGTNAGTT